MQMVNKVEVLRAMLFTAEDFNTILNRQDFPEFNEADLDFMIEFKKIYELGEPQLRKFIDKLNAEGTKLDPYSIEYYTSILKAGPFGNMLRDILGDLNQHTYWKPLPDSIGRNADNNHTSANTAGYPDSPQIDGPDRRLFANMPNYMRRTAGRALSSTNGVYYSSLASSTIVDNSYAKQDPQETYEKAQDGTLQQTPHGGYGVNDVKFLRIVQQTAAAIKNDITKFFNPEEKRRLDNQNPGLVVNEFTTTLPPANGAVPALPTNPQVPISSAGVLPDLTSGPNFDSVAFSTDGIDIPPPVFNDSTNSTNTFVGNEFSPTSNNLDNISKIFKLQKQVVDNGRVRMIELDLYGNEFDSDTRRDRLLKIGGKEYDKNVNLNTDEGQLGNVGDSNSMQLTQTTMSPFNRGGTPPGVFPPVPLGTGAVTPQPFTPSQNPIILNHDGTFDLEARNSFLRGLPEGNRNQNGIITITSYGQEDDDTPDSNTRARRGFSDNYLRIGSIALSPDIYNYYKPAIGTLVFIDGIAIGYYEDRTPSNHNGQPYGLCIDVYDPDSKIGPIRKNGGPGFKLSFGPRRDQIRNPSRR